MRITEFRVQNYRAFADSGPVNLRPGGNVFVGQNNSGKSALLGAVRRQFSGESHKDRNRYAPVDLIPPSMTVEVELTKEEFHRAVREIGGVNLLFTPGSDYTEIAQRLFAMEKINLQGVRTQNSAFTGENCNRLLGGTSGGASLRVTPADEGSLSFSGTAGPADSLFQVLEHRWQQVVFSFDAQRFSIGKFPFGREHLLRSDASNLPSLLAAMQGERGDQFRLLTNQLREVMNNVGNLSVAMTGDGFRILIWPTEEMLIPELSFPLDESGTGIAQVLSILYAAMTMESAIISIDEISSFLHPAATKALLRILQTYYNSHQYIVTTHSTEVIASGFASTVSMVTRANYDSHIRSLDIEDAEEIRKVCLQLGVALTDVFSADRVAWVEGETEELIFPYLYEASGGLSGRKVSVIPVVATGDFNAKRKRDRKMAFDVYQQLSSATSPLIHSALFCFDRESLSDGDVSDLQQESRGSIFFLPRRNLECYLIDTAAITFLAGLLGCELAEASVQEWLEQHGGDMKYCASSVWSGSVDNRRG